jgi:hypothetical protein
MASITDELIHCAAVLARTAPAEWQRFSKALDNYALEQMTNCVQSALPELPRAQGRAQQATYLAVMLSGALATADKQERRK